MATVREMKAVFTAQAKGLRTAMKNITKDIDALNKYNNTASKGFDKTNKSSRDTEKAFNKTDTAAKRMGARFISVNRQLKATEGQTLKVANRTKDVGVSANVTSKAIQGMGVMAKRQYKQVDKSTSDVSRTTQRFVKDADRGFQNLGRASLTLTNRLNDVGIGTGLISRNFVDMEKQANKTVRNTTQQFAVAGKGLATVSGASLTLKNRLTEVGAGTGTVARNFVNLDKQAGNALKNTSTNVNRTSGVVSNFRTNVQNSFGNFRKGFQDIATGFGQVANNASRSGSTVANVVRNSMIAPFREATNVVKGYAAVLGLLSAGSLAGSGMKRLSAIENANVSLEVMMGSADEASEFMDDILAFAKTTPFAFPDLAETSRNLIAFGMDKNKVVPTMQAIGDAAAGSGKGAEGLNQIAGAFGDMQVSGTLSMDQINRLSSAGVPALKILANTMNTSVDDMKKQISSGTMSSVEAIDTLVKGMQEGTDGVAGATASMGGLMERMKDTWVGSVDSMKSSISSNMAKWMTPIKQPLQDFMGWFGSAFGTMTDTSLAFFASMGPAAAPLRQAFSNIRDFIRDSFMPALKDIYSALQPLLALIGTGLVQAFTALSAVMKNVIGPIITMITNMKGFDVILAGIVGGLVTYRVTLLTVIAVQKTKALVTGAMTAATQLYFATVSAGSKIMTIFRALVLGQVAAQRALNASMLANPIGIVIAVLAGLALAFYTAYQKSETFRNAVDALWAGIVDGAMAVGHWLQGAWVAIVNFFTGAGDNSAQAFGKRFVEGLSNLWTSVKEVSVRLSNAIGEGISAGLTATGAFFVGVGTAIANALGISVTAVSDFFKNIGQKISTFVGEGLFGGASNLVKGFVEQFKTGFSSIGGAISFVLPTLATLSLRLAGLTGPIGWIITGVVSLVSYLYRLSKTNENVGAAFSKIWDTVKAVFSGVLQAIQPIFDAFGKIGKRVAKELGPEVENTIVAISDSFESLKPTFKEVGDTFNELVSVFGDMFNELKNVVGEAITEVTTTFKIMIPTILPVIKVLINTWLEIQKTIWTVVTTVVKTVLPMLLDAAKQILPMVAGFIKDLVPPIIEIARKVLPIFMKAVMDFIPPLLAVVKAVIPIAINIITTLIGTILDLAKMVLPILAKFVQQIFPVVAKVITAALKIAVSIIEVLVKVVLELVKQVLPMILQVVNQVFPIVLKIIEKVIPIIVKVLTGLIKLVLAALIPAIETFLKVVQVVFPVIAKVIQGALNIIIGILDFFIALFTGNWSGMWDAVKKIISNAFKIVWAVIKGAFDVMVVYIKANYNLIKTITGAAFTWVWNKIKEIWSKIYSSIAGFLSNIFNNLKQTWNNAKNTTSTIFNAIWNTLKSIWLSIFNAIRDRLLAIWNRIRDTWNNIKNRTSEIFSAIRTTLSNIWQRIFNNVKDRVLSIWNRIRDTWNTVKNKTSEIFTNIFDKISKTFNDIVDLAKSLPKKIGDGIKSMAGKVSDGLKAVSDKMIDGLAVGVNGVIKGVNWVLEKVGVDSTLPEWKPNKSSGGGGGQSRSAGGGNRAIHAYKDGTDGHPGGPAIVGDGGMHELISFPNGRFAMSPDTDTLVNLPRGTGVMSGPDTQSFMNSIPLYKDGIFSKGLKMVKGAVGKGVSALKDKASQVWDWAAGGAKGLMDKVLKTMGVAAPNISGGFGQVAKGAFSFAKNKMVNFVGGMLPNFGDVGGANFPAPFRMTSKFNPSRKHPISGKIQPHNGIDFAAPMGTPIPAQAGGTVSYSGRMGGYGNIVIVKSGGREYRYAHNSKNSVAVGDDVKAGQTVGLVGSTGDSTGPHVHYEVRVGGKAIDPLGAGGFAGASGASGQVKSWITQAINATGVPKSWLEPLATIAQKESGGNPRAINNWDSNARRGTPSMGLMQTIQPTFNAYKKKGMNSIYNPVHNAVAAINYIKSRYGNVFNTPGIKAMAKGGAYKGYANGGIVDTAQLAWIAEGGWAESIISHDPSKRASQKAIWKETGDNLGFTKGDGASLPPIEVNIAGMPIMLDGKIIAQAAFKHIDSATGSKTNQNAYMRGNRR